MNGKLKLLPFVTSINSVQTFYDTCQVPLLFFHVAWRILCRAILAKW